MTNLEIKKDLEQEVNDQELNSLYEKLNTSGTKEDKELAALLLTLEKKYDETTEQGKNEIFAGLVLLQNIQKMENETTKNVARQFLEKGDMDPTVLNGKNAFTKFLKIQEKDNLARLEEKEKELTAGTIGPMKTEVEKTCTSKLEGKNLTIKKNNLLYDYGIKSTELSPVDLKTQNELINESATKYQETFKATQDSQAKLKSNPVFANAVKDKLEAADEKQMLTQLGVKDKAAIEEKIQKSNYTDAQGKQILSADTFLSFLFTKQNLKGNAAATGDADFKLFEANFTKIQEDLGLFAETPAFGTTKTETVDPATGEIETETTAKLDELTNLSYTALDNSPNLLDQSLVTGEAEDLVKTYATRENQKNFALLVGNASAESQETKAKVEELFVPLLAYLPADFKGKPLIEQCAEFATKLSDVAFLKEIKKEDRVAVNTLFAKDGLIQERSKSGATNVESDANIEQGKKEVAKTCAEISYKESAQTFLTTIASSMTDFLADGTNVSANVQLLTEQTKIHTDGSYECAFKNPAPGTTDGKTYTMKISADGLATITTFSPDGQAIGIIEKQITGVSIPSPQSLQQKAFAVSRDEKFISSAMEESIGETDPMTTFKEKVRAEVEKQHTDLITSEFVPQRDIIKSEFSHTLSANQGIEQAMAMLKEFGMVQGDTNSSQVYENILNGNLTSIPNAGQSGLFRFLKLMGNTTQVGSAKENTALCETLKSLAPLFAKPELGQKDFLRNKYLAPKGENKSNIQGTPQDQKYGQLTSFLALFSRGPDRGQLTGADPEKSQNILDQDMLQSYVDHLAKIESMPGASKDAYGESFMDEIDRAETVTDVEKYNLEYKASRDDIRKSIVSEYSEHFTKSKMEAIGYKNDLAQANVGDKEKNLTQGTYEEAFGRQIREFDKKIDGEGMETITTKDAKGEIRNEQKEHTTFYWIAEALGRYEKSGSPKTITITSNERVYAVNFEEYATTYKNAGKSLIDYANDQEKIKPERLQEVFAGVLSLPEKGKLTGKTAAVLAKLETEKDTPIAAKEIQDMQKELGYSGSPNFYNPIHQEDMKDGADGVPSSFTEGALLKKMLETPDPEMTSRTSVDRTKISPEISNSAIKNFVGTLPPSIRNTLKGENNAVGTVLTKLESTPAALTKEDLAAMQTYLRDNKLYNPQQSIAANDEPSQHTQNALLRLALKKGKS